MQVSGIYQTMFCQLGQQPWLEDWQDSPWEVVYGGILVQNTSWANVAPSLQNLKRNFNFDPISILSIENDDLIQNIRPSGFYTRKSQTIKRVLEWASQYDFSIKEIHDLGSHRLRKELLSLVGIGPETADYIMMYAFERPGFICDRYSRRIFDWFGYQLPNGYDQAKQKVEQELQLNAKEWQNFHAMIVNSGKRIKTKEEFVNEFINC